MVLDIEGNKVGIDQWAGNSCHYLPLLSIWKIKNTKILILSLFLFIGKITIFEVQLDGIPEVDDVVYPKPQENVLRRGGRVA